MTKNTTDFLYTISNKIRQTKRIEDMAKQNKGKGAQPSDKEISGWVSAKKTKFLLKPIPLYFILLFTIIPVCGLSFYFHYFKKNEFGNIENSSLYMQDPSVKLRRSKDLSLVHPLLYVDIEAQNYLSSLKFTVNQYLAKKQSEGTLTSASVYLKDLNTGFFFCTNPDSLYDPASILKVPMMMVYLKQAENNPDILKKTMRFTRNAKNATVHLIKDKSPEEGKVYTIAELLHYMIVYSDNESFWMLSDAIDQNLTKQLDSRLNIQSNYDNLHYPENEHHFISDVNSIARYFNVLYNASYLNMNMSMYALNLLTKSTYLKGIAKSTGSDVVVAHKFGERTLSYMSDGQLKNLYSEFHEFGIVYLSNRPYLLGIMTRGPLADPLPEVVSELSKIIYDDMKGN